jgi:hypothetical protein
MLVHELGDHRCSTRLSCRDSLTHTSLTAADDPPAHALFTLRNGIKPYDGKSDTSMQACRL